MTKVMNQRKTMVKVINKTSRMTKVMNQRKTMAKVINKTSKMTKVMNQRKTMVKVINKTSRMTKVMNQRKTMAKVKRHYEILTSTLAFWTAHLCVHTCIVNIIVQRWKSLMTGCHHLYHCLSYRHVLLSNAIPLLNKIPTLEYNHRFNIFISWDSQGPVDKIKKL
jgi:hypothetical protein